MWPNLLETFESHTPCMHPRRLTLPCMLSREVNGGAPRVQSMHKQSPITKKIWLSIHQRNFQQSKLYLAFNIVNDCIFFAPGNILHFIIGHFRVPKTLIFKKEAKYTTFFVKMSFVWMKMKNHFHIQRLSIQPRFDTEALVGELRNGLLELSQAVGYSKAIVACWNLS